VKSYTVSKRSKKGWLNEVTAEFIDIKDKIFIDNAVSPETTYFYTVFSVDGFGVHSEPSIEVQFNTNKNQGKVVVQVKEEEAKGSIKAKKMQAPTNELPSVVKPMDDLDMSEI